MIQPLDELVALAKALARQNVKIPLYTYAPNASPDLLSLGSDAIEGLRSASWTVPPTADLPAVEEYRQALKKYAPGARADFNSLFAWAQARIFVEALSRMKGPVTREGLVNTLNSMGNFQTGILPPVTFSPTTHLGVKGLQPIMVEKGAFKLVGGFIDPQAAW
jgi:ABC-type branched-subunit amino acid transport system substrate-binding protein